MMLQAMWMGICGNWQEAMLDSESKDILFEMDSNTKPMSLKLSSVSQVAVWMGVKADFAKFQARQVSVGSHTKSENQPCFRLAE